MFLPIEYSFQLKEHKEGEESQRAPQEGCNAVGIHLPWFGSSGCSGPNRPWPQRELWLRISRISDFQPCKRAQCVHFLSISSCAILQSGCIQWLCKFVSISGQNWPKKKAEKRAHGCMPQNLNKWTCPWSVPTQTSIRNVFCFFSQSKENETFQQGLLAVEIGTWQKAKENTGAKTKQFWSDEYIYIYFLNIHIDYLFILSSYLFAIN